MCRVSSSVFFTPGQGKKLQELDRCRLIMNVGQFPNFCKDLILFVRPWSQQDVRKILNLCQIPKTFVFFGQTSLEGCCKSCFTQSASRCETGAAALSAWCVAFCKRSPSQNVHSIQSGLHSTWNGHGESHTAFRSESKEEWLEWRGDSLKENTWPNSVFPSIPIAFQRHSWYLALLPEQVHAHVGCAHVPMCVKIPCYMLLMPQQTELPAWL